MHDALKSTSAFLAGVAAIGLAYGAALSTPSFAEKTVMVGGAEMFPSKNIIENAVNSKDHTTLVTAVKAAGLVDTLSGKGPFTVFAPTNRAFEKLPDGHCPDAAEAGEQGQADEHPDLPRRARHADGAGSVGHGRQDGRQSGVEDGQWPVAVVKRISDKHLAIYDPEGRAARITIADVMQSNGVIHVIDTVEQPN